MNHPALLPALAGIVGVVVGAILSPWMTFLADKRRESSRRKIDALKQQLEVYRPLYEKLVIMPEKDPEHYFGEWEEYEFRNWLSSALDLLLPNLHLLPNEVLERIHGYREFTATDHYDCEADARWLYRHVDERFRYLRNQLRID